MKLPWVSRKEYDRVCDLMKRYELQSLHRFELFATYYKATRQANKGIQRLKRKLKRSKVLGFKEGVESVVRLRCFAHRNIAQLCATPALGEECGECVRLQTIKIIEESDISRKASARNPGA
jgi:hypothetical protein